MQDNVFYIITPTLHTLTASLLYSSPPLGAEGLFSRFAWRVRSLLAGHVGNIVAGRGDSWGVEPQIGSHRLPKCMESVNLFSGDET